MYEGRKSVKDGCCRFSVGVGPDVMCYGFVMIGGT
jgi:hypothetical protein